LGFKNKLQEKLRGTLTEGELNLLPRGFQTIGRAIIIKLNPILLEKKQIIADSYLELLPHLKSVYINTGKIQGTFREPENIQHLSGEKNSIVEHREHGIVYKFDFTKIMFSQGNLKERKFLATLIKDNEIVVDMFAGIGYFSLPIGLHSNALKIYSIEINPEAYEFLVENIRLNKLEKKINPICGNSKEEVLRLSAMGLRADHVIMGVFPAPVDYIKEALTLTKDEGTIFHYEGVAEKEKYMDLFEEFKGIAEKEGYHSKLISKRFVKSYGPKIFHVVLDIRCFFK
jgi:tRNA wybutosine-synthesizing protein 2